MYKQIFFYNREKQKYDQIFQALNLQIDIVKITNRKFGIRFITACLSLFFLVACSASQEKLKIGALDHFNRGNGLHEKKKFNLAIQEYQAAIALHPEEPTFYYNLGLAFHSIILYDRAIEAYRKAIELQPNFAQAWYNLALSLDKIDDTENAFIAYEKYQKINKIKAQTRTTQKEKPVVTFPKQGNTP